MKENIATNLPVIAIGAGSGGSAAVRQLLASLPVNCPYGVIVSHPGFLPEPNMLPLPVEVVTGKTRIQTSRIYLVPSSNTPVFTEDAVLSITEAAPAKPVDALFQSLAQTYGKHTTGIVLSGEGDDGTYGVSALKAAGSYVLVQHPYEATPADMPKAASCAALVDDILPLAKMPAVLHEKGPASSHDAMTTRLHFLEETIQQSQEAILVRDADFKIVAHSATRETYLLREAYWKYHDPASVAQNFGLFHLDGSRVSGEDLPLFQAILKGLNVQDFEFILRHPDAPDDMIFLANASPVKDEQGNVIGGVSIFDNITERKQIEARLQLQQTQLASQYDILASIFEQAFEHILVVDTEFQILFANSKALRTFGEISNLSVEHWQEHFGMFKLDQITPLAGQETAIYQCITTGRAIHNQEFYLLNDKLPTGSFCSCNGAPLRDDSGKLIGAVMVFDDITEQKRSELALFEQKNLLSSIIEQSSEIIFVTDQNFNTIMTSRTAKRLAATFFSSWSSLIDTDGNTPILKWDRVTPLKLSEYPIVQSVTYGKTVRNFEMYFSSPEFPEGVYMLLTTTPLRNQRDEIIGAICIINDISEIKFAELEIERQRKLLEVILKQSTEAIIALDQHQNIILYNDKATKILGNTDEFEYSENSATWEGKDADTKPSDQQQINIFYEDGKTNVKPEQIMYYRAMVHGESWRGEERFITSSQIPEGRYFSTSGTPLRDDNGKIIGVVTVLTDITPIKMAERSLKERGKHLARINLQLRQNNEELSQFAYIASHDLQEPLRTLSGFVNLLQNNYADKFKDDERLNFSLNSIQRSADRMRQLVTGLLEYSRIGSNRILEVVSLNQLIEQVIWELNALISDSQAHIEVDPLPAIQGYPLELKLLFQNLLSNAIKFHQPDALPIVKISAESIQDDWLFAVEDNGIGIEPEYLEKIFIIFQRLHNRQKFEGVGIGLAHCKKIVTLHGGRIWVESTPNKGSIFKFTLPKKLNGEANDE